MSVKSPSFFAGTQRTYCENPASIRVLEKIGMRWEGKRRKILPIAGEWKDNYMYAILEEDYWALLKNQDL